MPMTEQLVWLGVLALAVACVSWTATHEEVFREPREWFQAQSESSVRWWQRKFFYMWTCEYCLSHYVTAAFLGMTGFQLLLDDWRGYILAWFGVVAIANVYMSAYARLRVEIKRERATAQETETRTRRAG